MEYGRFDKQIDYAYDRIGFAVVDRDLKVLKKYYMWLLKLLSLKEKENIQL